MNWDKIKEKHPNAGKLLKGWYIKLHKKPNDPDSNIGSLLCDLEMIQQAPRTLYDFFDEQGVYLSSVHGHRGFYVIIGECDWQGDFYKTRTEADEKAFEQAF